MISWAELSTDHRNLSRYEALSEKLTQAGIANTFTSIVAPAEEFEAKFAEATRDYQQLRLGGAFCEKIFETSLQHTSNLLFLRSADAVLKDAGGWWPRNFLSEGFSRAIVADLKDLDITGAVFVCGVGPIARAAVWALSRLGFSRFAVSALDEKRGRDFVAEVSRTYFKVQFDFIPRHMITQLPSIHSFALNTVGSGADDGALTELAYFNFLKPHGVWLDMGAERASSDLEAEALSVDAVIETASRIYHCADMEWVRVAFGVDLGTC